LKKHITAHGGSSVSVSLSPTDSTDFQSESWKQRETNNLAIKATDEILNAERGREQARDGIFKLSTAQINPADRAHSGAEEKN